jgi:Uma2 family endonuclease
VVGGNEAGMKLGQDIRAADAAVWLRSATGPSVGRLRHVAPVLAVEVAGQDEDEDVLLEKARWYLAHGVSVVWLVLPERREVLVLRSEGQSRHGAHDRLPVEARLPDLTPQVARFFAQMDQR